MTKNVEITIDIKVARAMLELAGFSKTSQMSDEDVFKKVLSLINCYGATSIVK